MKIYIGCDHAAFKEKEELKEYLLGEGHEVIDKGTDSDGRCNYPDYAKAVAEEVQVGSGVGVLLCGSGIGVSIVANRFKRVRAALCRSEEDAALSRQHNDSNILCVGARLTDIDQIKRIAQTWIKTEFEGGRHEERIELFNNLGE